MKKTFQQLNLSNAFLFAAALEDSETCRLVLEIILGTRLPKVKVHAEHSILVNSDFRSIRLDIYASDEAQVSYNIEAQNDDKKNLAKRSRYHQAEMDVASLKPGDDFNDLKPSYVIFICTFDPFGKGLYRYTFEERCMECDMGLGDDTKKIFLNTKGKNEEDVPKELVHFLRYMEQSNDEYVSQLTEEPIIRLHEKVTELKTWRKLEARYMTVEEWAKDRETRAREEASQKAKQEAVLELLEEYGAIPEHIREVILSQWDLTVLKRWHKLAARVETMEQFEKEM
ncbi:MAG: Rpn family recombination-promoting nuclease/putative transposase [Roseburia sp.]|nr:Rpn family recombination-promoting nuclease/putative transposase [Roseburia sp.]MCM1279390.1 Rpn family recombination-promoting nuclease/putative transposase [Robinsoniella sp.]